MSAAVLVAALAAAWLLRRRQPRRGLRGVYVKTIRALPPLARLRNAEEV